VDVKTSVIICSYNYARFLDECLTSVISQTRPPDEVIVVDDGSTDETAETVRRFPDVRYIRQNHAGKAMAFNRGFEAAQGDILCHLDADDYWMPFKLERILQVWSQGPAGGITHLADYVDPWGRPVFARDSDTPGSGDPHRNPMRLDFRQVLQSVFLYRPRNVRRYPLGVFNTVTVHRAAVEDLFPLPASWGLAVDWALFLGAARFGLWVVPEKLSAYRFHGGNYYVGRNPGNHGPETDVYRSVSKTGLGKEEEALIRLLMLELQAHGTMWSGRSTWQGVGSAVLLLVGLLRRGWLPHWKHWLLPIACLMRWGRLRDAVVRNRVAHPC